MAEVAAARDRVEHSEIVIASNRFFFYSNEGDPREPVHVHVQGGDGEAKFWVGEAASLERSSGFDARTLRKIAAAVQKNRHLIEDRRHEHFSE